MPRILTELPDGDFHSQTCECGHDRIDHYDEISICLKKDCACPKFEEKETEDD